MQEHQQHINMSKYLNEEVIEPTTEEELDQTKLEKIIGSQETELPITFDPVKRITDGFNYFKINEFK